MRVGTREALLAHALRPGGGAELLSAAGDWLQHDDRELRYGAAGVVLEVLGDRRVVASIGSPQPLLDYLTVGDRRDRGARPAPPSARTRAGGCCWRCPRRAAQRSSPCAAAISAPRGSRRECMRARHPDVRSALSDTILGLRQVAPGPGAETIQRLRHALEGSAKPPRDPTRLRPGTGRGRDSRRMK